MTGRVRLTGWGRTAPTVAEVADLDTAQVSQALSRAGPRGAIARGLGRAYGDAAQNAGGLVIRLTDSPGAVAVDEASATVQVPAGTSMDSLIRVLLPRGLFVPVSPGTRFVTIGGAVAADIHGKNHHVDGSIGNHLSSLELVDGTGELRRLDPESTPQEFWATVGGMGLTGIVVSADLRLRRVETAYMKVDTERVDNLDELMELMETTDQRYTYSVAWIDLATRGASMGRAVLTRGEHATADELAGRTARHPRELTGGALATVPGWTPGGLVNPWSVRAFNELWYRKTPRRRHGQIVATGAFFHPLDRVANWNRLYGSSGLVQYQLAVPLGTQDAVREVVDTISRAGLASFLAVLKRFGEATPAPLSFPGPGWTLALDLPASPGLVGTLDRIDNIVLNAGGRLYLAKDSRTRAQTVAAMYPRLEEFRAVRRRMDPQRLFTSDLARRLDL